MTLVSAIALVVAWVATYVVLALRAWPFPRLQKIPVAGILWPDEDLARRVVTWADGLTLTFQSTDPWADRYARDFRRVYALRALVASLVGLAASYLIG